MWLKFLLDLDVHIQAEERRQAVCPIGNSCLHRLQDRVVETYVQQGQHFMRRKRNMARWIWLENMLRGTTTSDVFVRVADTDVCHSCFAVLCKFFCASAEAV